MLELNARFPDDGLTELAWHSGITALQATGAGPRRCGDRR
jgi:hypothetical protein